MPYWISSFYDMFANEIWEEISVLLVNELTSFLEIPLVFISVFDEV